MIKNLFTNIPDGRKIEILGKDYYKAVSSFSSEILDVDLDLDEIILENLDSLFDNELLCQSIVSFSSDEFTQFGQIETQKKTTIDKVKDLLKKHVKFDPVESLTFANPEVITPISSLHSFQDRIRRKVINLIYNGHRRFLIHMPTGSGKTRTASEITLDFVRFSSSKALLKNNIKILWIAQSSELCQQAFDTMRHTFEQKATSEYMFVRYFDKYDLPENIEDSPAIIFCGIQKLYLNFKKQIWSKIKNDNYLIIVDEAHRSVASEWKKALDYFSEDNSVYLFGLTATPGLGNNENSNSYILSTYYNSNKIGLLDENFQEIPNPIKYLTQQGYLSNVNRIDIDAPNTESADIKLNENGEFTFSSSTLSKLSINHKRNASICSIIKKHYASNEKILIFTCSVEHNRILKTLLKIQNIESETIDANSKNRNDTIDRFKNGNLNIILNFGVLTTGFDAPKTNVCIIARPIQSTVMYSQMVGRILRGPKNNGNLENFLYTIKDNLNHGAYDTMFNSFNNFYL